MELTVNQVQLADCIKTALEANWPLMIMGDPGCGKTAIAQQVIDSLGWSSEWIILHHHDPVDFSGVPYVDENKRTRFAPIASLPTVGSISKPHVIILDEFTQGVVAQQNIAGQMVNERRIGGVAIDPEVRYLATGNPMSANAGTTRRPSQIVSRFSEVHVVPEADPWRIWASQNGVNPMVRAFIAFRPALISNFDPARSTEPYSCGRTLVALSKLLDRNPSGIAKHALTMGTIGTGAGTEYLAFEQFYQSMPDPDLPLADPKKPDKLPTEPATLFAYVTAVTDRCRDKKDMANYCTWLNRFHDSKSFADGVPRREFVALGMRDLVARDKTMMETKAFTAWATDSRNTEILV